MPDKVPYHEHLEFSAFIKRLEAVENALDEVLPSHKVALESFESRLLAVEEAPDSEDDAWNLQGQIHDLERQIKGLERELSIRSVSLQVLQVMTMLQDGTDQGLITPQLRDVGLHEINSHAQWAIGRMEEAESPTQVFNQYVKRVSDGLKRLGLADYAA